jgi:pyruvate dehydrogenase (quinone)
LSVQALAADRPAVLDVHCDLEVPPIPPHAEFAEVKSMMQAMLKGDPGGLHLVVQGIKTKIQEALPGRN